MFLIFLSGLNSRKENLFDNYFLPFKIKYQRKTHFSSEYCVCVRSSYLIWGVICVFLLGKIQQFDETSEHDICYIVLLCHAATSIFYKYSENVFA